MQICMSEGLFKCCTFRNMNTYKVVIVGNANTGKTSILNRYVFGKFHAQLPSTIGVEFTHKDMDDETKLVFWDTAGQERFQSLMSSYYRGANAIMFVYDVTDRDSFLNLEQWWREYLAYGDSRNCAAMLVGNKIDLARVVAKKEATAWAVGKGVTYSELSSKDGENVTSTFDTLIQKLKMLPQVQKEKIKFHSTPKHDRCCY